jgi:hypothetical protein
MAMRSQPGQGEASRRRAEGKFKSTKKADSQAVPPDNALRQAETEKTTRLRALRLAKEAADKDAADREAAAALVRRAELRRRAPRPQISDPSEHG